MSVQAKIAQKRAELQERTAKGTFKKKHDPFLLWGEYPHGWVMIKDAILCIMLVNALIGQLKQIDIASLMASKTIVIANETLIAPVMASTATIEPKAPQEAKTAENTAERKIEAQTTAYSEIETCQDEECKMANGKKAHVGAVACPRDMKLGTKLMIDGNPYMCEDRTAKTYDGRFDIFMGYGEESYQKAIAYGKQSKTITIIE